MSTPQDPQRPHDPADVPGGQPPPLDKNQPVDPYGSAGSTGTPPGGYARAGAQQGQPGYQQDGFQQGGHQQPNQPGYQQNVPPGFQPAPPTPPANTKNRNIIIAVAVVVAVAVVGFFVWQSQKNDTKNAAVGACINVIKADPTKAQTEQIDCGDPRATYVVTETGKSITCDKNEATYTEGKTNVCLRPNLKVGECATVGSAAANGDIEKVDCVEAGQDDVKVAALDMASSDPKKCTADQSAFDLPKRNIVYCFVQAKS